LHENAEKLIRQLNIPFVTELLSKAVLSEDDALFAGVFDGQASSTAVQELASKSDFILALGVWLTDLNTLGWSPADHRPDFDKTAFVSFDTVKYGTYFSAQVALADVIDRLLETKITREAQAFPRLSNAVFGGESDDQITYQGFYDFISGYIDEKRIIDEDTIIGSDASLNYFGSLLLKVSARRGFIAQPSYSSIGYITPAATGISLAKKENQRVMVFTGDGGFQMTLQCLSTQVRFALNPIIFVIDNRVFGVEQWLHDASIFSSNNTDGEFSKECVVQPWNYSGLAEVFRCKGEKVSTYGGLRDAISRAKKNEDRPSIIQVVVPERSIPDNARWKIKIDEMKKRS
jgi:indolepyruvate decarboxylase